MNVEAPRLPLRTSSLLWTAPNVLTFFRIALVPLLVYLLRGPGRLTEAIAAFLFLLAGLTDYFDGYLARKHGIVTTLGKFLDPLADKLIVVSVLVMLAAMPCPGTGEPCARIPPWLVVLIVGRELAVTGLRSIASGEGITLGAEELGKYKMIFQMFALHGLLIHFTYLGIDFHLCGMYFLWISTVISLWSGTVYTSRVVREIRLQGRENRLA